mmetsp:Transcript_18959/g.65160  ORF Transcript_18959/g.65160 Transcript_18959/m.65160 type:complete len:396 (-) Transcript_18959:1102-2289(-)
MNASSRGLKCRMAKSCKTSIVGAAMGIGGGSFFVDFARAASRTSLRCLCSFVARSTASASASARSTAARPDFAPSEASASFASSASAAPACQSASMSQLSHWTISVQRVASRLHADFARPSAASTTRRAGCSYAAARSENVRSGEETARARAAKTRSWSGRKASTVPPAVATAAASASSKPSPRARARHAATTASTNSAAASPSPSRLAAGSSRSAGISALTSLANSDDAATYKFKSPRPSLASSGQNAPPASAAASVMPPLGWPSSPSLCRVSGSPSSPSHPFVLEFHQAHFRRRPSPRRRAAASDAAPPRTAAHTRALSSRRRGTARARRGPMRRRAPAALYRAARRAAKRRPKLQATRRPPSRPPPPRWRRRCRRRRPARRSPTRRISSAVT